MPAQKFPFNAATHAGIHNQEGKKIEGINSIKSQTNRSDFMKSGTRDEAEGKIKEIAGKVSMDPDLEAAGKDENLDGRVQDKIGQVKKLVGK